MNLLLLIDSRILLRVNIYFGASLSTQHGVIDNDLSGVQKRNVRALDVEHFIIVDDRFRHD